MSEHVHRSHRARTLVGLGIAVLLNAGLGAQSPAAERGKPQPAPAPATPAPAPASAAPAYTYRSEGRRDPFVSLLGRGSDAKPGGSRPAGASGLLIGEINIKGIIRDRSGFIAMVQGADNRTYVVRAGDRLMDGTVKAIVEDAVVFSQDVNDPLSLVKQKEIRKTLRSTEGGRG